MPGSALVANLQDADRAEWKTVLGFLIAGVVACLTTSRTTSLSASATSSAFLWLYCVWKGGSTYASKDEGHTKIAWIAGGLLGLAQLCQRASGGSSRWSLVLTPWTVLLIRTSHTSATLLTASTTRKAYNGVSRTWGIYLVLASALSIYVSSQRFITPADVALEVCRALISGVAFILLEGVLESGEPRASVPEKLTLLGPRGEVLAQSASHGTASLLQCTRDVAAAIAISCGLSALAFEDSWPISDLTDTAYHSTLASYLAGSICLLQSMQILRCRGSLTLSVWCQSASAFALLIQYPQFSVLFCTAICLQSAFQSSGEVHAAPASKAPSSRWKLATIVITLAFFGIATMVSLMGCGSGLPTHFWPDLPGLENVGAAMQTANSIHPAKQLVSIAERSFEALQARQSTSLHQAVQAYKKRYGIPPPPLFDEWYKFARKNDVLILDDYDNIHNAMQPFWALKPFNIRSRVQEAIGYEGNALIVLMVRNGRISRLSGGLPWQREAIAGMVGSYVETLPDLDIAFNAQDEPRIVVPHDELSRMVDHAKHGSMAEAFLNESISNGFSRRPSDMDDGLVIRDVKTSRFNEYAHQNTWVPSRLSCPPESPARNIDEDGVDDTAAFALGPLGFVHNQTAATDICNVPSLHGQHAFFDRPNAFNVAHDLIPVFSESKVSSFQDIPYPSLWHWYGKLFLNETRDMHVYNTPMYDPADDPPWSSKRNNLYWRGSTTGGYSRNGGWRRHHRQRLVQLLNGRDQAAILVNNGNSSTQSWQPTVTSRRDHDRLFDVALSGVGQCDPADCHAQEEFFQIAPHAPLNETWQHKHVLDIDGNAFSARFYALLRSRSLVYKAAVFREWHDEWLVPWLHYIPLSIGGGETLEALRFFAEGEGTVVAEQLADVGRQWAGKVLRRVDMEAWMFRCLLEYARVVDDNRGGIGYNG